MTKPLSASYRDLCAKHVAWYQKNGRHKNRITVDSDGIPYVIGDWAWNRTYPYKPEIIEPFFPK